MASRALQACRAALQHQPVRLWGSFLGLAVSQVVTNVYQKVSVDLYSGNNCNEL